ncbi:hypothetical protein ACHAXA_010482 [Cyclostephanos tholiformis]|uniref:SUF system FeS cluster assembly SufBD core domain-containing protein n=1 Tax=Cyclostephanos tholiformis TaxID=382380 RepID=A0ABD3R703_9STRA
MEASVRAPAKRHPFLAVMVAVALAIISSSTSSVVVEAFATTPLPRGSPSSSSSSSSLGVSIGLGPESDDGSSATKNKSEVGDVDDDDSESSKKFGKSFDPYDPEIVIRGEDGLPLPHITDFEPYRESRMSSSDKAADAWFKSLLESGGGDVFLGPVSASHMDRLITKAELVDEPVLRYGEDEEWTPYVSRRLPTSPLYPAYGLETYGLPVLRRGAEAWKNFDVNGIVSVDYSTRPLGIGTDHDIEEDRRDRVITSLRDKGAWLEDDMCAARLVYVNGRFCPGLSKQTDMAKNLDRSHFESGMVDERTLEYLVRLPDGFTDRLAADVPDTSAKGPLTSYMKLSGPDHNVGKATSQFAINGQQGTAAFAALNSVKAGCVAYVESSVTASGGGGGGEGGGEGEGEGAPPQPVLIVNAQTPSGGGMNDVESDEEVRRGVAFHPRTLVVAGEGSVLSLAQMCVDLDDDDVVASSSSSSSSPRPTLVNGYTQIYVGRDANVTHTFLDESGGIVTPDVDMSDEEASALFTPSSVDDDGSTAPILLPRDVESRRPALRNANFQAIDVHVVGDNGSYASTVMEIGGCASFARDCMRRLTDLHYRWGEQRTDMQTNIHHVAQGTLLRQEQRNMVGGRSTASFRGRIRVEQSAQQTDSKQLSRTVLLSDYARIWATPSLEIVADDVQCTHGATVSDLSEEELFYLRSRGLDMTTARNMLMYAFVEEIGGGVDTSIMGGFDDENGLRKRIIRRLENVVPKREKKLVGGEFQSV